MNSLEENEELAKEVIKCINNSENKVQEDLEKVYDELSENYLKPLRRRIPFTGQKMNWNISQLAFTTGK